MLDNFTILTHTHSDCSDLWMPYFDSYRQHFNINNGVTLVNITNEIIPQQIIYNERLKYSNRLIYGLEKIKTDFVLLSFEDMILYNDVNVGEIDRLISLMTNNSDINFIRLIKSGIKSNEAYGDKLYKLTNNDFLFSLTPTIWNRLWLLNLLNHLQELNIWELEENGSKLLMNLDIKALFYYNHEKPRGQHYDSSIYPHMCSAIYKGKWNFSEYKTELEPIIEKYKINPYDRGLF